MNERDTPLIVAIKRAQGRMATGFVTAQVFADVRVRCRACGGVTVFPVLLDKPRPTPAPCAHCGKDI